MNKLQIYQDKWRQQRINAGLCVYCGKPNDSGKQSCEDCRKKLSEKRRAKYASLTADEKLLVCEKQNEYQKKRYAARRAAGLCTRCGKPVENWNVYCDECAAKVKNIAKK